MQAHARASFVVAALTLFSCKSDHAAPGAAPSATAIPAPSLPPPRAPHVVTQGNDVARTGAYLSETILTPSRIGAGSFGMLFARPVDGDVYAQPLYLWQLRFPSGPRNVVYVATEHDTVYAFDADDPSASDPIWQTSIGQPTTIPNPYFGLDRDPAVCKQATYNLREVGITSTPVIDLASGTLYVVGLVQDATVSVPYEACTDLAMASPTYCQTNPCNGPQFRLELHALDIITGAERPNSPAIIEASVPGGGDGNVNGTLAFDPTLHLQRPGLLLSKGRIYIATASYGEVCAT